MFVAGMLDVLDSLHPLVGKLVDEYLEPSEAAELVQLCIEAERVIAAMRLMAARAVDSDHWKARGFRSAAAWMAAEAGTPVGPAIVAMETLRLLDKLPATAAAFREGRLSLPQINEIADVASEWPVTEQALLDAAEVMSLNELREECRRVKAAAITDEDDRYQRLRRGRYLRSWTDQDGAVRVSARLTPDEGARLLAEVDTRCGEMEAEARAGGWYEGHDAHRADALVDLARSACGSGEAPRPEAMIHVWVDYEALVRGHTLEGEQCDIPGVDITAVAHAGRNFRAHQRTALECRDATCIVPGCDIRRGLQFDHKGPYAATRLTSIENAARLCRWHHYQKSHLGYTYRGGPGTWEWIPPDIPTPPDRSPPSTRC